MSISDRASSEPRTCKYTAQFPALVYEKGQYGANLSHIVISYSINLSRISFLVGIDVHSVIQQRYDPIQVFFQKEHP